MKIWKIVGITGLVLASLGWSGAAQAERYYNRHYNNNQRTCQNYGHHQRPHWAGERQRERFQHQRSSSRSITIGIVPIIDMPGRLIGGNFCRHPKFFSPFGYHVNNKRGHFQPPFGFFIFNYDQSNTEEHHRALAGFFILPHCRPRD